MAYFSEKRYGLRLYQWSDKMKKIYYEAGMRIRLMREERHYTREYLSEKADISPKFLYEIENGQKGFSADTLYKLAEALDTNSDYILFGEYRGSTDDEALRLLNLFDVDKRENVLTIIELMYKILEK